MHKRLKIFGIVTSIGMLIVLLQGALVTKTDSAEGCGSTWPLCFGEVIPQTQAMETLIEYTHRAWSGLMGLFVIILAVWSWKKLSHLRETKFMALMAVLFIVFQGLMGAGAVIWGNSDIVLALHFGISTISFASVVLLTVLAFEDKKQTPPIVSVSTKYRNYLFFVLVYCYLVIYTGAYVKHTDATYVCGGFPLCNNQFFPDIGGPLGYQIGIQLTHRIAAVSLAVFIFILWIWTMYKFRRYKSLVWGSTAVFLLVLIQAAAGISILYADTYLTPALFHSLTISLLFTVLCYIGMIITRTPSYK
ncbi:heme A synthase [Salibacterium salarium]|uniref:Heme A synthase n=1 Tax=Salibacterium salarium TaxID=284579 RepID=A0A3R9P3R4_9BACI|nr:heme A synthase [Salibacterium salarium]RSL30406.1 heme A synthase [Salibacterium salarium]